LVFYKIFRLEYQKNLGLDEIDFVELFPQSLLISNMNLDINKPLRPLVLI